MSGVGSVVSGSTPQWQAPVRTLRWTMGKPIVRYALSRTCQTEHSKRDPRRGRIITIGSAGVDRITGVPGTVYYMTKGALQAFNRGLARELGPRDITVNLVQPGSTNTDSNPETGEFADYQRGLSALGRFKQSQDVAAAVAFLATPAARQITGTILTVDGGALA
ncbi:hypothetical protein AGR8A_pTi20005 [Agrobacterium fabrum str. J-07]|nr:hypothetical protein AGR8A_pTi20005 [Agrobacterium fabrum str. J-07]